MPPIDVCDGAAVEDAEGAADTDGAALLVVPVLATSPDAAALTVTLSAATGGEGATSSADAPSVLR